MVRAVCLFGESPGESEKKRTQQSLSEDELKCSEFMSEPNHN